jgi:hypothetical protein
MKHPPETSTLRLRFQLIARSFSNPENPANLPEELDGLPLLGRLVECEQEPGPLWPFGGGVRPVELVNESVEVIKSRPEFCRHGYVVVKVGESVRRVG